MDPRLIGGALLALLASGCQRDPGFVGYWEIVQAERDGIPRSDVGFLDFDGEGGVVFFTRYLFAGGAWVPDPSPMNRMGPSNVFTQDDVFEAYQEEGETYDLELFLSLDPLSLDAYHPWRAEVSGPAVWWPSVSGEPAPDPFFAETLPDERPTSLVIRR